MQTAKFEVVKESQLPRGMHVGYSTGHKYKCSRKRALACMDGDDRIRHSDPGEEPTSRVYSVGGEDRAGKKEQRRSNLVVYAAFSDPSKKTAVSQIITYPVQAVRTDLKKLPDSIELRIQYRIVHKTVTKCRSRKLALKMTQFSPPIS